MAEGEGDASNPPPSRGIDITDLPSAAGKLWEEKVSTANKAWEEQVKSAAHAAETAVDKGISAASDAVRSGVSAALRESEAVSARLTQIYDTGVAHYEATEQQALDALKQGIHFVRVEHPQASAAVGVAAFFTLLRGPRRFLLRHTIGRLRSEEAMFRAAEQRYSTLRERVEGQQGELQKLQERLQAAEVEYQRGRSKLKATAGELESLASRVRSSNKAARGLIEDLRELPSKAALQLRSDSANAAAAASTQAKAVDKSLRRLAKQYGF